MPEFDRIKIHFYDLDSDPGEIQEQINNMMGIGYELMGPPVVAGERLLYHFITHKPKDYIRNDSAYPSKKQVAYLCWAYQANDEMIREKRISRQEASFLIKTHKQEGNGSPLETERIDGILKGFRELSASEQAHQTKPPPREPAKVVSGDLDYDPDSDDEYDSDIPF